MALSLVTGPADEPFDVRVARSQLRIDIGVDHGFLSTQLIPAVRDRAEVATRRAIPGPQTWDLVLDAFPRERYLEIPKPPLVLVTFVKYVDTAGVTQTWSPSNYLVQTPAGPRCRRGRIALPFASIWPITLYQMGAVTVRFQCGYGDPEDVPPLLITGMLLDLGTLYENREAFVIDSGAAVELPSGSKSIYQSFKSHPRQQLTN